MDTSRNSEFTLEYVDFLENELAKNGFLITKNLFWGHNGFITHKINYSIMGVGIWFGDEIHQHSGVYLHIGDNSTTIEHNNPNVVNDIIEFYDKNSVRDKYGNV